MDTDYFFFLLKEVLELTQRKFLRHMAKGVSEESEPYPRLLVVDFLREKERQDRIEELKKQAHIAKKKNVLGPVIEDVKGEGEEKSGDTQVKNFILITGLCGIQQFLQL